MSLLVCGGTGCTSNGSLEVRTALEQELARRGLAQDVKVVTTGCNGLCGQGPILVAQPEGVFFHSVTPEDVPELVEVYVIGGKPPARLLHTEEPRGSAI
ncbi:MAG: (2Fe-2S) ferredoxin domain-containing protein, partial [Spirochaetaceae bacterium]|nr:(2Fe-2S) ferredoxin domain-containing protein [Spirochaetaceae bacterium]